VSGSAASLQNFEPIFQQDLNGDGTVGAAAVGTTVESLGSTSLVKAGTSYYLYANGTSSGPSLKFNGIAYVAGEYGNWTPIAVEAKAGGGYQVAWQFGGSDQYTIWYTDSNGNFVSNPTGGVSGSAAALENFEPSFVQDLNGDGVIGVPGAVEAIGATSLVKTGTTYYLYANGTTSGPSLKYNGIAYVAGEYGAEEPPRLAHGDGEAIAAAADLLGQGVRDPEAGQAADRFALGDEVARGQHGLGPGQHDQAVVDPGVL